MEAMILFSTVHRATTAELTTAKFSTAKLVTALLITAALTTSAPGAETYPNKPGRLILPFGAGGSTDVVGRIFAQKFSEVWGQPLVIDNRAGASGIMGTELGAR